MECEVEDRWYHTSGHLGWGSVLPDEICVRQNWGGVLVADSLVLRYNIYIAVSFVRCYVFRKKFRIL